MRYNKPFQSIEQQIVLLSQRGLIIDGNAAQYLRHLNYYRLSGYWLPFQQNDKTHQFKKGTQFSDVLNLYIFDRELRLLLLDAIERIEVSVKTQWAYYFAESHGAHAYMDCKLSNNIQWHAQNIIQLEKELERSDEIFITHYKKTYTSPKMPPIWVICEIISFGLLSRWLKSMKASEPRNKIAKSYCMDYTVLISFIEHLTYLRNLCAHHSRVWNKKMTKTMQLPRSKPSNLISNFNQEKAASRKIYNTLVMMIHLLSIISSGNHFKHQLIELVKKHTINPIAMGFPTDWQKRSIWMMD